METKVETTTPKVDVKETPKVEVKGTPRVPLKIERRTSGPKAEACEVAFNLALKEAQLSDYEIQDLWADYEHLINPRNGAPYNYISVYLPREKPHYRKGVASDPDLIKVPNTEFGFSKAQFYNTRNFQRRLRTYYHSLGLSIQLFESNSRWILKIFMR